MASSMLMLLIGACAGAVIGFKFGNAFKISRKSDNNTYKPIRDKGVNKS